MTLDISGIERVIRRAEKKEVERILDEVRKHREEARDKKESERQANKATETNKRERVR